MSYNPTLISHRGANRYAPQNTLSAFKKAAELGASGFETDVHMTKDGYVVLCHDYKVDKTSNGFGNISSMSLNELRSLDFGSYFSDKFVGTRIPTLDEFLSLCENYSDLKVLNIEIKRPKKNAEELIEKTLSSVKRHNLFHKLIISSFDYSILVSCKEFDSNCKTGFLYSPDKLISNVMWFNPVSFAKKIKADALHPHWSYVDAGYIKKAHSEGIKVNPWVCNSALFIKYLLSIGTDGIITDVPDRAKSIIRGDFL